MPAETTSAVAPPIRCAAVMETVHSTTLLRLPPEASRQLPSRGQVAVRGELDGHGFDTVVEPDGRGGHWLRVDAALLAATGAAVGEPVALAVRPVREWPEPQVPADLGDALTAAPEPVRATWRDITPMARWEWVRWVNATRNPATRARRVEVSISKLGKGMRRPCCFDLSSCTDPDLARSGKLPGAGRVMKDFASEPAIYGVVLVAGLVVIVGESVDESWEVFGKVLATVVVFWAAHVYASIVAHLDDEPPGLRLPQRLAGATREAVSHSWVMLVAALLPLTSFLFGHGFVLDGNQAVWGALWLSVLLLGVHGYVKVAAWTTNPWARAASAAVTSALGLVMIGLKVLVH